MHNKLWAKIVSVVSSFALLFNSFAPLYVYAQEEPTTKPQIEESSQVVEETSVAESSLEPTIGSSEEASTSAEVSPSPEATAVPEETTIPTPASEKVLPAEVENSENPTEPANENAQSQAPPEETFTVSNSITYPVVQGGSYSLLGTLLSITFNKVSELGFVTLTELKLTPEQVAEIGAVSDTAYEITSTLTDGTFEYDLTLPKPQDKLEEAFDVKFAETEEELVNAQMVTESTEQTAETITINGLTHFTVFVLVNDVDNGGTGSTTDDIANGMLSTIQDAYIKTNATTTNFGNTNSLIVRSSDDGATDENWRALVEFNLSSIPSGSTINSAKVRLFMTARPSATVQRDYDIYRITQSWVEGNGGTSASPNPAGEVRWDNQPTIAGSATNSTQTPVTNGTWVEWEVTADVQAFVNGTYTNYGWLIRDRVDSDTADDQATFNSRESGTENKRPQLSIDFTQSANINGFQSPTAEAVVNTNAGDNNGYSNPDNAFAGADSLYATDNTSGVNNNSDCTGTGADKHTFYNYDLSVPTGATINGIEVRQDLKVNNLNDSPFTCTQLSWNGGTDWTTAKQSLLTSADPTPYYFGNSTDDWGRTWTYSDFTNATFRVRVANGDTDNSNDSTNFSLDWIPVRVYYTPDTTAPETTIDLGPTGDVSDTSATFTFSANETSTFQCQLDGGGFSSCTSPKTYNGLSEGVHTFDVKATDTAGNPDLTPASRTWTVDTVPPTISDSVTPSSPDGLSDWYVTLPVVSYTCSPDVICPSDFTFGEGTGLTHTETVVDAAGNFASVTSGPFDIDATPPTITGDISPTSPDVSGWYNISTGAPTVTYTCSLDVACPGPFTFGEGTSQSHSETVTDVAGNSVNTTASDINVDLTAPQLEKAETQDTGGDGNIDAIKLTFSENINDDLLDLDNGGDGWDIPDPVGNEQIDTGDFDNDNILVLNFGEGLTPDTGNTPTVIYTPSGGPASTHDLAGNELVSDTWLTTDKASPVLLSAQTQDTDTDGHIDKILATFSEDLNDETVTSDKFDVSLGYSIVNINLSGSVVELIIDEKLSNDTGAKPDVSVFEGDEGEVEDLNGNTALETEVQAADGAAPVSTIDSPLTDSIHNGPINISGSSSDGQGDTVSYTRLHYRTNGEGGEWIEIPDSQRNNASGDPFDWSFDWTPLSDGIYDIKAEATDDSVNVENSPTVTHITYDAIAPTGNWEAPPADTDVNGTVTLEVSASDATAGVKDVTFSYSSDGVNFTAINTVSNDGDDTYSVDWDTTGLALGDYTLRAVITDEAGNSIMIDIIVGVSAVVSEESGASSSYGSVTITWTTDRETSSRVIYDTVSHGTLGAAPNYGYASSTGASDTSPKVTSHSVTITGLSNGTTYYYRTVSEGSPVAVGEEKSFQTLSTAGPGAPSGGGTTTTATLGATTFFEPVLTFFTTGGEVEEVLGNETEEVEEPVSSSPEPSVKGAETPNRSWLWWLLAIPVLGTGYYYYQRRKS